MGELVSRIILTRCFDACVYNTNTSAVLTETQIKVKDFLKMLLGKAELEFADGMHLPSHLLSSFMGYLLLYSISSLIKW
jgi:hypothetical protein